MLVLFFLARSIFRTHFRTFPRSLRGSVFPSETFSPAHDPLLARSLSLSLRKSVVVVVLRAELHLLRGLFRCGPSPVWPVLHRPRPPPAGLARGRRVVLLCQMDGAIRATEKRAHADH